MNRRKQALGKLIIAARKAHQPQSTPTPQPAPVGFATRIAARWAEAGRRNGWADVWERLCWWGASASIAVCLLVFAQKTMTPEPSAFDLLLEVEAVDSELPRR